MLWQHVRLSGGRRAAFNGLLLLVVLTAPLAANAQTESFVEPGDGRMPIVSAIDRTTQSLDLYIFRLSDTAIRDRILAARGRGVTVRALLEPCPGEGTACPTPAQEAMDACIALVQGQVAVKWANPAFPKTHAKTMLIDDNRALIMTLNPVTGTFEPGTRDYGVLTSDPGVVDDLRRAFTQDWQQDTPIRNCMLDLPSNRPSDPRVQDYPTLVVSPDNGRDALIGTPEFPGLIRQASVSLKIQMQRVDPQANRGIVPALVEMIQRGVQVQLLLRPPEDGEPGNAEAARLINEAGGEARFQSAPRVHAKMIIADGAVVYLGSHNLARSSLDQRREVGWVTDDGATLVRFDQTFDSDWAKAPAPLGPSHRQAP